MDKLITFIDLCVRSAKTTSDRSTRQSTSNKRSVRFSIIALCSLPTMTRLKVCGMTSTALCSRNLFIPCLLATSKRQEIYKKTLDNWAVLCYNKGTIEEDNEMKKIDYG